MNPQGEIYLVDDETEILDACRQTFELEGYRVRTFQSGNDLLPILDPNWPGVVISDVRMPDIDGLALLDKIHKKAPAVPVILLTGHGDVPMAINAIRAGAYDFLEKPAPPEYLIDVARRAMTTRALSLENLALKNRLEATSTIESRLIGNAPKTEQLRQTISTLSAVDVDVLLIGETGSGKELAAHCLHDFSSRKKKNFVALNCGAIPAQLVESELFGHEKGAFTSAVEKRIGKIEHADGGTLFLDEIESMPLPIQIKLLRTLQERTIERVGSNQPIKVNFRVIAATKADLHTEVQQGRLREDLFYRLNVARIEIPPLRSRESDALLLLRHFINSLAIDFKCPLVEIDTETIQRLKSYSWPGNVRELKNVAQQLLLNLPLDLSGKSKEALHDSLTGDGLDQSVERFEKHFIIDALERNQGRITVTAEELQIPRKKLYLRMKKFNLSH
jgi:two-component system, NtrC family, C4-dicarboxylate transport response regulator DctD